MVAGYPEEGSFVGRSGPSGPRCCNRTSALAAVSLPERPTGSYSRLFPLPLPFDLLLPVGRHLLAAVFHVAADGLGLGRQHANDLERLDAVVDVERGVVLAGRLPVGLHVGRGELGQELLAGRLVAVVHGAPVEQADHDELPTAVSEIALPQMIDPVEIGQGLLGVVQDRLVLLPLLLGGGGLGREPLRLELREAAPGCAARRLRLRLRLLLIFLLVLFLVVLLFFV